MRLQLQWSCMAWDGRCKSLQNVRKLYRSMGWLCHHWSATVFSRRSLSLMESCSHNVEMGCFAKINCRTFGALLCFWRIAWNAERSRCNMTLGTYIWKRFAACSNDAAAEKCQQSKKVSWQVIVTWWRQGTKQSEYTLNVQASKMQKGSERHKVQVKCRNWSPWPAHVDACPRMKSEEKNIWLMLIIVNQWPMLCNWCKLMLSHWERTGNPTWIQ